MVNWSMRNGLRPVQETSRKIQPSWLKILRFKLKETSYSQVWVRSLWMILILKFIPMMGNSDDSG